MVSSGERRWRGLWRQVLCVCGSWHVSAPQHNLSFDDAHPALADQHYLRSEAQNQAIAAERVRLAAEAERSRCVERDRAGLGRTGRAAFVGSLRRVLPT